LNYNKKVALLILLGSLLRILLAGTLELGNDEVYYQTYAGHLQWNYFDHPPMVALLIRLSTGNLFFHQELFIRLGSVCCAAAGTWFIYITGKRLYSPRAGWIAALLYNTSFYTSIIAGTFILPDSPQVFWWILSLYFMIRILDTDRGKRRFIFFVCLGISAGLCMMSKVHGVFIWFGFGGYILFRRRDLLKSAALWISIGISVIIILPMYWWNLQNHFITYAYHQGRIRFWGSGPDMDHFIQQLFGSVFYSNPVNFILYVVTIYAVARKKSFRWPKEFPLLLWLSLPLILVLLWTSLFSETLPHWSGPAYISLMLLTACYLDAQNIPGTAFRWLKAAVWVYGLVIMLGWLAILYLPFPIGSREERILGTGDITLDMTGWKKVAGQFDSLYRMDVAGGKMKPGAVILSDYWFPAGHLDHYFSIPYRHNLLAVGPLSHIHHFAWLNARRPRLSNGSDAYFIFPSNEYRTPEPELKSAFMTVEDSLLIPQYRSGIRIRNFVVYRMHDFRGDSLDYLVPGIQ
jgi:hypothetical protein